MSYRLAKKNIDEMLRWMMEINMIKKTETKQIRARADVANISENIRDSNGYDIWRERLKKM